MLNMKTLNEQALEREAQEDFSFEQLKAIRRADFILKENKKFEKYYTKLYDTIYYKLKQALKDHKSKLNYTTKNLRDDLTLMHLEIVEANLNMKVTYNISEIAEKEESALLGMFNVIYAELEKL